MLSGRPGELLTALRRAFPRWQCVLDGDRVRLTYRSNAHPHRPPRQPPGWTDMLATLASSAAAHGIRSCRPLPLRGLDDAELTFSAVQALDPYLKHGQSHTYRHGFLPQPVVRFTGQRDEDGDLRPGFATAFVNTSIVQPIGGLDEHAALLDAWIGALSALGLHAGHLAITGRLAAWTRPPVAGITLRLHHQELTIGDAVLLWSADDPNRLATDLGSGLERLRWALSRRPWPQVVYDEWANAAPPALLDAVRTATLIVGAGVTPSPRGPGSAVRRLLRGHDTALGVSRLVRWAHAYWSAIAPLPIPWPEVCSVLDAEAHNGRRHPPR